MSVYQNKPATASLHCFWNSTTQRHGARIPKIIFVGHALYAAYQDELQVHFRNEPFEQIPSPEHPDLAYKSAVVRYGISPAWLIESWT